MKTAFLSLLLSAAAFAAPVNCLDSSVINANITGPALFAGCELGGLVFDRFTANFTPPGGGVFLSSVGTAVVSATEIDLGFQFPAQLPPFDILISYRVTSALANIIGIDNAHNLTGNAQITDVACDAEFINGTCPAGHVLGKFTNPPNMNVVFAAQTSIFVQKDIGFALRGAGGSFTRQSTDLTAVPEPATIAIGGLGLLLVALRRRLRA